MKKFLICLLTLLLIFSFVACDKDNEEEKYLEGTSETTGSFRVVDYKRASKEGGYYVGTDSTKRSSEPTVGTIKVIVDKNGETLEASGSSCPITVQDIEAGVCTYYLQLFDQSGNLLAETDKQQITVKAEKRISVFCEKEPKYLNLLYGINKNGQISVRPYAKTELTSITIPKTINNGKDAVKSIAYNGFNGCSKIETVTFAEDSTVSVIGSYAFKGCTKLTSITVPNTVGSVGIGAFQNCSGLKTVKINKAGTIDTSTFENCTSLTTVTMPNTVKEIRANAFKNCSQLNLATLPSSLQAIGNAAFQGCTTLTSITIPSGVTTIGNNAFNSCTSLSTITLASKTDITYIGSYAFYNTAITTFTLPTNSRFTTINANLFEKSKLDSLTIPENVTTIISAAFANTPLVEIVIPDTVKTIGSWCFTGCTSLTSVKIGSKVETINNNAFRACTKLTEIFIPKSVKVLDYQVFYDSGLTEIRFGVTEQEAESLNYDNLWKIGCNATIKWGQTK